MIRDFEIEDLDKVMELWLDTNIKAHSFVAQEYWNDNYAMVKEMMPQAMIYVYEVEQEIKAFIGLMEGYIAGIFVSNDLQSQGIGKVLLDYVKERHQELSLIVYKKNNRAVEFYLREGCSIIAEQVDDNTGEIEISMKWAK